MSAPVTQAEFIAEVERDLGIEHYEDFPKEQVARLLRIIKRLRGVASGIVAITDEMKSHREEMAEVAALAETTATGVATALREADEHPSIRALRAALDYNGEEATDASRT